MEFHLLVCIFFSIYFPKTEATYNKKKICQKSKFKQVEPLVEDKERETRQW